MTHRPHHGSLRTGSLSALIIRLLLLYLVMALYRVLFFFYNHEAFGHIPASELSSILKGSFIFDSGSIFYINLLFVFLSLIPFYFRNKHSYQRMLATPPVAVAQLFNEVQRMGDIAMANYTGALACFHEWSEERAAEINHNEDVLDYLNKEITAQLVEVKGLDLNENDTHLVGSLFHVVNDFERVGDHSTNLLEAAQLRMQDDVKFSAKAMNELENLSGMVAEQLKTGMRLFRDQDNDPETILGVEDIEETIDNLTEALRQHHVDRLKNKKCSAKNGMIYLDILTNLERIGDHAENIATSVVKVAK